MFYRTIFLWSALALFATALPQPAFALEIAPLRQTTVLDPGTTQTVSITIHNDADHVVQVRPTVDAFWIDAESGTAMFGAEDDGVAWVTPQELAVTLSPAEIKTIEYGIRIPRDAKPGSHYLALFTEHVGSEGQIQVGTRLGSLLFLHVAGPVREELRVDAFDIISADTMNVPQVRLELTNQGSIHVIPTGEIVVEHWLGHEMIRIPLNVGERKVLPNGLWVGTYPLDDLAWWEFGPHRVHMRLTYGLQQHVLSGEAPYWFFPSRALVACGGAALFVFVGGWVVVRRKKTYVQ